MEGCRLSVKDLACRRGDRVLFRGLSFELNAGEALQVAGPNGTGKSSLLRIVAGLLRPFSGTVELEGSLGLVDERPALEEHLALGKALDFWARIDSVGHGANSLPSPLQGRGRSPEGAEGEGVVDLHSPLPTLSPEGERAQYGFGLEALTEVPVRFLSTGQRKRAALARLLGQDAAIWLLDEPLNGLDTATARECEKLVADHCRAGGIVLIASHQPFAVPGMKALAIADYALPLPGGEGIKGWGSEAAGLASTDGGGTPPPNPPPQGGGL
jgi:heme exporter protein A